MSIGLPLSHCPRRFAMPPSDRAGQPATARRPRRRAEAGHRLLRRASGRRRTRAAGVVRHLGPPRVVAELSFNSDHIAATSQAICDYRAQAGTDGPLFLGRDTHALSEPAFVDALEVFAGNGVRVLVDAGTRTRRRRRSRTRSCAYNRGRTDGLADGVVVTPSHNPPSDGGFKYNPPQRRAGRHRRDRMDPGPGQRAARGGLRGVRRVSYARARAADTTGRYDYVDGVRLRPRRRARPRPGPLGRDPDRRRPARRRLGAVLGGDRRPATASTSRWSTRSSTRPGGS